jgi:formylglycine-generating enzyme required for sulfatase activity
MKMTTTLQTAAGCLLGFLAFGAAAADPVISDVVVRQRWPWSRLVDINYVLSCEPVQRVDIAVAGYNGATPLTLPPGSFSGDLHDVSDGSHRIVWDPTVSAYTNSGVLTKFRVTLTPTPVPLYMVVDLTKEAGAEGQLEYVYEGDLTNGVWGAWIRNPVTNDGTVVESVVWTGVTNAVYKTDKLVLRRVPAASVTLGSPDGEMNHQNDEASRSVRITRPFYLGVYAVTQRQWENIAGASRSWPSFWNNTADREERPVERVSYYDIRENASSNVDNPDIDWPGTMHAVAPNSFMGRLRAKTGSVLAFDLPTEAQWEHACRAGTTGAWNNGTTITSSTSDANLAMLGRYARNGGQTWNGTSYVDPERDCLAENATAKAGSYLPNAWGLYDMHGNVWEWCLDYYITSDDSLLGEDPAGPATGSARVARGGGWNSNASFCRSARRYSFSQTTRNNGVGFRVAAVAVVGIPPAGE